MLVHCMCYGNWTRKRIRWQFTGSSHGSGQCFSTGACRWERHYIIRVRFNASTKICLTLNQKISVTLQAHARAHSPTNSNVWHTRKIYMFVYGHFGAVSCVARECAKLMREINISFTRANSLPKSNLNFERWFCEPSPPKKQSSILFLVLLLTRTPSACWPNAAHRWSRATFSSRYNAANEILFSIRMVNLVIECSGADLQCACVSLCCRWMRPGPRTWCLILCYGWYVSLFEWKREMIPILFSVFFFFFALVFH